LNAGALFWTKGVDPIDVAPISIEAAAMLRRLPSRPWCLIISIGILPTLSIFLGLVSTQRRAA
jgi:hypothetical protein